MLEQGLILQIISWTQGKKITDLYQKKKNKKVIGLMKGYLGRKIISKLVGLKAKS